MRGSQLLPVYPVIPAAFLDATKLHDSLDPRAAILEGLPDCMRTVSALPFGGGR
jgi:hypothetical protein